MLKTAFFTLLLFTIATAQPPGPPPQPPGTGSSPGAAANLSLPHVVGKLSNYSPTRFTVQREMGAGGPTANMDFHADAKCVISGSPKSGDRAIVLYEMNQKGEGYRALAVVRCPEGSDPRSLIKNLPPLK